MILSTTFYGMSIATFAVIGGGILVFQTAKKVLYHRRCRSAKIVGERDDCYDGEKKHDIVSSEYKS